MPVIGTPLPHITVHVLKPPGIGGKGAHIRGLLPESTFFSIPIGGSPVVIRQGCAEGAAEVEGGGGAGPAGIFPLRFAGQGVEASGALANATAEGHGVLPAHIHHGALIPHEPFRLAEFCYGVGIQVFRPGCFLLQGLPLRHGTPLGLGDRGLAQEEALELHQVLGALRRRSFPLGVGRAHPEAPWRDPKHGEAGAWRRGGGIGAGVCPSGVRTCGLQRFSKALGAAPLGEQEGEHFGMLLQT